MDSTDFARLAAEWHQDTDAISSPSRKRNHPAYRQIVAMGMDALPYILSDLRDRGGDWYGALSDITGENPVPPETAGSVRDVNACWFRWAKEHGIPFS